MKMKITVFVAAMFVFISPALAAADNAFESASGNGQTNSSSGSVQGIFYPLAAAGTAIGFGTYLYLKRNGNQGDLFSGFIGAVDGFFSGWMNFAVGIGNFFEERGNDVGGFWGGLVKGFGDIVTGFVGIIPATYGAGRAIGADPSILIKGETYSNLLNGIIQPYADDFTKDGWMGAGRVTGLFASLFIPKVAAGRISTLPSRIAADIPVISDTASLNKPILQSISTATEKFGMNRAVLKQNFNYVYAAKDLSKYNIDAPRVSGVYQYRGAKRLLIKTEYIPNDFFDTVEGQVRNTVKHEVGHIKQHADGLLPLEMDDVTRKHIEAANEAFVHKQMKEYVTTYNPENLDFSWPHQKYIPQATLAQQLQIRVANAVDGNIKYIYGTTATNNMHGGYK